jgi:hypothetical protein
LRSGAANRLGQGSQDFDAVERLATAVGRFVLC